MYSTFQKLAKTWGIVPILLLAWQMVQAQTPGAVSSNLRLWYKADAGSSTTTDGAAVTSWAGQASTPNSTGSATYKAVGFNYNPAMTFNGTSNAFALNTGTGLITAGTQSFNIFAVYKTNTAAQQHTILGPLNGATGGNIQYRVNGTGANAGKIHLLDDGLGTIASLSTSTTNTNVVRLSSFARMGTGFFHYNNGLADGFATIMSNFSNLTNLNYAIGKAQTGTATDSEFFGGDIAELIVYNSVGLTPAERLKVESYLAIKYGVTLEVGLNYTNSAGTTIWNVTTGAGYGAGTIAVGRDDGSGLTQKQSKSVSQNDVMYLTAGTTIAASNAANAATIANNEFYFTSNDDGLTTFAGANTFTSFGLTHRMNRIWQVQKTGFAMNDVKIYVDITGLGYTSTNMADYSLVFASNSALTSAINIAPNAMTGNLLEFYIGGSQMIPGSPTGAATYYFTMGYKLPAPAVAAPGGVNTNLRIWHKADAGSSTTTDGAAVTSWTGNSIAATGTATYKAVGFNYNPVMTLNGTSNAFSLNTGTPLIATGTQNFSAIAVYRANPVAQQHTILGPLNGATGGNIQLRVDWVGANAGKVRVLDDGLATISSTSFSNANVNALRLSSVVRAGTSFSHYLLGSADGVNTITGNFSNLTNLNYAIGKAQTGVATDSEFFSGDMAEVIFYDNDLSAADRNKIESYLAIKYGIAMSQNYVLSDGAKLAWDMAANATYNNNMAVIARDDNSGLSQKQSKSANAYNFVTLTTGTTVAASNAANSATFGADLSRIAIGDNNASGLLAGAAVNTNFAGYNRIMARQLLVQHLTPTARSFTIEFDLAGLGYPSTNPADYKVVTSTDGVYDGVGETVQTTSYSAGKVTYTNAGIATAQANTPVNLYVALLYNHTIPAAITTAPAGVNTGVVFYNRGDAGITATGNQVTEWADQTGNSSTNPSIAASADVTVNSTNFNPSLLFTGASGKRLTGMSTINLGATPLTMFVVARDEGTTQNISGLFATFDSQRSALNAAGQGMVWLTGSTYALDGNACVGTPTTSLINRYRLVRGAYSTAGNTAGGTLAFDGRLENTSAGCGNSPGIENSFEIGGRTLGNLPQRVFKGTIGEVLVYNTTLSAGDIRKIESHLAIKYGLTLDQTTATDYVLSNGTRKAWSATGGGIYNQNITVIARDDAGNLNQKQSRSVNAGGFVTLTTGSASAASNAANANAFGADGDRISFGDNGASAAFADVTTLTGFTGVDRLMAKQWKAQKITTVGRTFAMEFDLTGLGYTSTNANDYKVIVSFDGVYDGVNEFLINTTLSGNTVTWTNPADVNPANDEPVTFFFTLAYKNPQSIYYWVGGATGNWTDASSWATTVGGAGGARTTPAATDILIFDGSDISSTAGLQTGAVTVGNVITQAIGQLKLVNNATINLQGAAPTANLTINGDTGNDLDIPVGSNLNVTSTTPILFTIAATHLINVGGGFNLGSGAVFGAGDFTLLAGATFTTADSDGLRSIGNTGVKTFTAGANYVFNNQTATTVNLNNPLNWQVGSLTINCPNPVVTANNSIIAIGIMFTQSNVGTFILGAGGSITYTGAGATLRYNSPANGYNYVIGGEFPSVMPPANIQLRMTGTGNPTVNYFNFFRVVPSGVVSVGAGSTLNFVFASGNLTGLSIIQNLGVINNCVGATFTAGTLLGNPIQTSATLTSQPTSQAICLGNPVTFTVATATAGVTYQWRKAAVNILGATNASYTIAAVAAGDAGSYDCVVTSGLCNTTSNAATLTINTTDLTLGAVTPICEGTTAFALPYSAALAGTNQYSITSTLAGFVAVSNAALPVSPISVNIPANTPAGTYNFTLVARNSVTGCVSGNKNFTMTVNPVPQITNALPDQYYIIGGVTNPVAFTSSVAGTVFRWTNVNNNPAMTLPASGVGTVPAFNATALGVATVTVTPEFTAGGVTCFGTPRTFRIFVDLPPPPPSPATIIITGDLADRIFTTVPFGISATASSNLPVTITIVSGNAVMINGQITLTGIGDVTIQFTVPAGNGYLSSTITRTFRVLTNQQTISGFETITDRAWNSGSFLLNATSSSGAAVVYTVTEGQNIATISGNVVRLNAATGRVTISATAPANGGLNAATPVVRSFNVIKANQSIGNIVSPNNGVFGQMTTATTSASANSGLPVLTTVTGNATIAGNTLTITGAGTIVITYAQAGNDLWNAAANQTRSFTIERGTQTVSFTEPVNPMLGTPINLNLVSSVGLPFTIRFITGTGTVNGSIITATSGGEVIVEITQAGNDNYAPMTPVRIRFFSTPNIVLTSLSGARFCGGTAITINYTTDAPYPAGNIFAAYISDANGDFTNSISLGNFVQTTSGSLQGIIPAFIPTGTGYRVQVRGIIYSSVSNSSPAISVDRLPERPFINYAANGDLQVITPTAGLSFQWFTVATNGTTTAVAGATSPTLKPTANGIYQVAITTANCTVASNMLTFNLPLVTAAEDLTLEQATQVYPNPHEGNVNVKTVLKKAGAVSIVVTDVLGKTVYTYNETATTGKFEHNLRLEHLTSGVYLITVTADGNSVVKKTVKQ